MWHGTHGVNTNKDEMDINVAPSFPLKKQEHSPWGLDRMSDVVSLSSQSFDATDFRYLYEDWVPVDIYVVDSGVRVDHQEFEKNRARWGYPSADKKPEDTNGRGTAVASVAAGIKCGVAKHAKIVACKVDTSDLPDVIKCLQWIQGEVAKTKTASVVCISWGIFDPEKKSTALDEAVEKLIQDGIHCVAAAGDLARDACNTTPARVKDCNTVGGCSIADMREQMSNYGAVLTIFAPGKDVLVADKAAKDAFTHLTGTSVASAHVAGLIAYFISLKGNSKPKEMTQFVKDIATRGVLENIGQGSPNLLANNGHRIAIPFVPRPVASSSS